MKRLITLIYAGPLVIVALAGCATKVPDHIRIAPAGDVRVEEVQQQQEQFIGSDVRWGGHIISVHNQERETLIEVLSRTLSEEGKPLDDAKSGGRFMARIPGFLEPEEYPKDRLLTVTGQVREVMQQTIGSYPYPYPVVEVKSQYLWPEEKEYPHHYYRDPFYDPYYPYFYPYYPYWRRYPFYW